MIFDDRLNLRIPKELKEEFQNIAVTEGYERLSTAVRDVLREIVKRGYIRTADKQ